jgi:hypothetical protein
MRKRGKREIDREREIRGAREQENENRRQIQAVREKKNALRPHHTLSTRNPAHT